MPERLISSLRACAMGGHRVSVLVVVVLVVGVVVHVVLAGGSRRVAKNDFVGRFLVAIEKRQKNINDYLKLGCGTPKIILLGVS